jgi:hydroxymethylpyrimidine/phosphomethylpyrimidine kinase
MGMTSVLLIGGWDPLGRAGLLADQAALQRLGRQSFSALVTAQTAQDDGTMRLWGEPISRLRLQLEIIFKETQPSVVKSGMIVDEQQLGLLLDKIPPDVEWIVDPVLRSSSGQACYLDDCQGEMYRALLRRADLITPNLPEAEALTGMTGVAREDLLEGLKTLGARRILLKGGHGQGDHVQDLLTTSSPPKTLSQPRLPGRFRGTGCRLASLVAGYRSQGIPWVSAVNQAHEMHHQWLQERATASET